MKQSADGRHPLTEVAFPQRSFAPSAVAEYAHRGTVAMLRQSGPGQVEAYQGSRLMQTDMVFSIAEQYGVRREDMVLFEGKGESAAGIKVRPEWEQMLDLVRSGSIGLVIFVDHHRLTRNTMDTEMLIRTCRGRSVLLHVGRQVFDPASYHDRGFLRVMSAAFSVMSESQIEWFELSKHTLARRLALRLRLPVGLVWADPKDLNYRRRLEAAGLLHWLDGLSQRHHECSVVKETSYYILPYPDREVAAACELRIRWLLETQSPSEVYARIYRGDSPWPRKGLVPVTTFTRFDASTPMKWARAGQSNTMRWLRNPMIYGIYTTYRRHFAHTTRAQLRAAKGIHYTRAGHRLLAPLPDALSLVRAVERGGLVAPSASVGPF